MARLDVDDLYHCKKCGRWHPLYVKYAGADRSDLGRRLFFDCPREHTSPFYAGRIGDASKTFAVRLWLPRFEGRFAGAVECRVEAENCAGAATARIPVHATTRSQSAFAFASNAVAKVSART